MGVFTEVQRNLKGTRSLYSSKLARQDGYRCENLSRAWTIVRLNARLENVESAICELPSFQFRRYLVNYDAGSSRYIVGVDVSMVVAKIAEPADLPKPAEWIREIILACKCVWIL